MDHCCIATRPYLATPELRVTRCATCGLLWGTHTRLPDGRAWDEAYIPESFAKALRLRRERQAAALVGIVRKYCGSGRVLDYGAGQGVFIAWALRAGVDAFGCDLDVDAPLSQAPKDRMIALSQPWGFPAGTWPTLVMLDVLEHHEDPVGFLKHVPCEFVVLKLPNATGPAARLARLAAKFGKPGLLQQLFLVGENFPHRWLASKRGLRVLADRAGFEVVAEQAIVEVGTELPDRMRGDAGIVQRAMLWLAGAGLGALGTFWSDASVVVLKRN